MSSPTETQREEIDACILARDYIGTIKRIRAAYDVDLNEVRAIYLERYRQLRAERPADFTCTDEEYWQWMEG